MTDAFSGMHDDRHTPNMPIRLSGKPNRIFIMCHAYSRLSDRQVFPAIHYEACMTGVPIMTGQPSIEIEIGDRLIEQKE